MIFAITRRIKEIPLLLLLLALCLQTTQAMDSLPNEQGYHGCYERYVSGSKEYMLIRVHQETPNQIWVYHSEYKVKEGKWSPTRARHYSQDIKTAIRRFRDKIQEQEWDMCNVSKQTKALRAVFASCPFSVAYRWKQEGC